MGSGRAARLLLRCTTGAATADGVIGPEAGPCHLTAGRRWCNLQAEYAGGQPRTDALLGRDGVDEGRCAAVISILLYHWALLWLCLSYRSSRSCTGSSTALDQVVWSRRSLPLLVGGSNRGPNRIPTQLRSAVLVRSVDMLMLAVYVVVRIVLRWMARVRLDPPGEVASDCQLGKGESVLHVGE